MKIKVRTNAEQDIVVFTDKNGTVHTFDRSVMSSVQKGEMARRVSKLYEKPA